MTKKTGKKTTIYIDPLDMGGLVALAEALDLWHGRSGNVTALFEYQLQMVKDFGPRVVAASLAPERLAEVAGTLGQEE